MFTVRPLVSLLLTGLLGALGAACGQPADGTESAGAAVSSPEDGGTPAPGTDGAKCSNSAGGRRCNEGLECTVSISDSSGVCRPRTFGDEGDACGGDSVPVACGPLFVCKKESPSAKSGICTAPLDGEEGGPCGPGIVACESGLECKDESGGLGLGSCVKK